VGSQIDRLMSRLEITTPDVLPEETGAEAALRPSRLDEFVGQVQVKASLQIAIDAAKARGEPLDHTLFFGPPGLGKTTLATLLAREMGVQLRTTSGPVLEKPGDLVSLLTTLQPGDVLFIDEIHRLRPVLEEFLYPAMEDYRVEVRIADGPHAQTIPMAIERLYPHRRHDPVRPADSTDASPLRNGGAAEFSIPPMSSRPLSRDRRRS
jgi:Holliday junction DNA helicase RuvB